MQKTILALIALLALSLSACNLGAVQASTATEIVLPTETTAPEATSTSAPSATAADPSDTPEPSATATPEDPTETPTATPTATEPPVDPEVQFGDPTLRDEMNNDGNWASSGGTLPNSEFILLAMGGGQLHVTAKQAGFDTWWFTWPSANDMFLQMTVEADSCSGKAAYGLILRGPSDVTNAHGYVVLFSCDGSYRLARLDDVNPYTLVDLIAWTSSERINAGADEVNVLGVLVQGDVITIYANGFKVAEFEDDRYSTGRFGLFTNAGPSANFLWHIDQLLYWNLD